MSDRLVTIPAGHAEAALERLATFATNERLARLLTMQLNADTRVYLRVALRFVSLADADAAEKLIAAFLYFLVDEARRRVITNTTAVGAVMLRWVVTDDKGVTAADVELLRARRPRYRWHPDGGQELQAIFDAALVALVARHRADTRARQLLRIISGALNDFPRLADSRVREQVRQRRRQLAVEIPSGGVSELEKQLKVRLVRSEIEHPFATIVMRAGLTRRERTVIELRMQNLTQVVVADHLRISQPRVHEIEQSAIDKLRVQAQAPDLQFSSAGPYIWTEEIPLHK